MKIDVNFRKKSRIKFCFSESVQWDPSLAVILLDQKGKVEAL